MRRSNGPMSMRAITRGGPSSNLDYNRENDEDDGPTVVQDYHTRKEIKANEEDIRKGKLRTWISIGIVLLTLVLTISLSSWYTSHVKRFARKFLSRSIYLDELIRYCQLQKSYNIIFFSKLKDKSK